MSTTESPTMRTVAFPSEELPPPAPFEIDIPVDWDAGQVPGVLLVAGPREWPGRFRPNVTVSATLVRLDVDLVPLAQAYVADSAATAELHNVERIDDDTVQALIEVQLEEPAMRVVQSMVLFRVRSRPELSELGDLFTVTASCDAESAEAEGQVLLPVVQSFRTA